MNKKELKLIQHKMKINKFNTIDKPSFAEYG